MNEEQIRKEFEELVVGMKDAHGRIYYLDFEDGIYVFKNTHDLWTGFKLSREAMKSIKLPVSYSCPDYETAYYNAALEECKDAIQQAGYKVEE